ncbi:MAG: exopolyphosphatase [Adlercreutzia equolifaciens]
MARLGVIDLGSNSVRLVVYETKREDAVKPFRTLVDEKKMAGLAAYVTDGALSNAGIARAVAVLGDLLKLADNLNCARVDIFATAVLRNCANSEAATAAIEAAIDHKVRVLSAREEAHLVRRRLHRRTLAAGTLIDVGGGSTELTALAADGDHAGISIPFGCVLAYANYVRCVIPTPAECRTIADAFRRTQALPNLEGYRSERLYGIGGSVRASRRWSPPCGATTRPRASAAKTWKGSPSPFRATSPFSPIAP